MKAQDKCVFLHRLCVKKSAEASEFNAVQESSRKWPLSSGFILLTGSTATRTLAYLHIMNLNAFCSSPHLHFVTGCFSWLTVLWIFQCFSLLFAEQMFFTENKKWKNRCLNTSLITWYQSVAFAEESCSHGLGVLYYLGDVVLEHGRLCLDSRTNQQ